MTGIGRNQRGRPECKPKVPIEMFNIRKFFDFKFYENVKNFSR